MNDAKSTRYSADDIMWLFLVGPQSSQLQSAVYFDRPPAGLSTGSGGDGDGGEAQNFVAMAEWPAGFRRGSFRSVIGTEAGHEVRFCTCPSTVAVFMLLARVRTK